MKNGKRTITVILLAAVVFFVVTYLYSYTKTSKTWARNLKAENIESIEMTTAPSENDKRYKKFDESEFEKIVETINNANGFYRAWPEEMAGGYKRLYIVIKNGDVHTVSNQGNIYLEIDGDSYKAKSEYLSSFNEMLGEGNSAVPQLIPYIEW